MRQLDDVLFQEDHATGPNQYSGSDWLGEPIC